MHSKGCTGGGVYNKHTVDVGLAKSKFVVNAVGDVQM